jgi:hypothetical protein
VLSRKAEGFFLGRITEAVKEKLRFYIFAASCYDDIVKARFQTTGVVKTT